MYRDCGTVCGWLEFSWLECWDPSNVHSMDTLVSSLRSMTSCNTRMTRMILVTWFYPLALLELQVSEFGLELGLQVWTHSGWHLLPPLARRHVLSCLFYLYFDFNWPGHASLFKSFIDLDLTGKLMRRYLLSCHAFIARLSPYHFKFNRSLYDSAYIVFRSVFAWLCHPCCRTWMACGIIIGRTQPYRDRNTGKADYWQLEIRCECFW